MKTLKESILQDADIALSMTDDDAKKAMMFSTHYEFKYTGVVAKEVAETEADAE